MPIRDTYLTLTGSGSGSGGTQKVLSTASTNSNSPFDLGNQVSSEYGQSPYQSTNLNTISAQIGQAPKKFFFVVQMADISSGGSATTGITISLMTNATAGGTGRVTAFQSAKILFKNYTTGVTNLFTTYPALLVKIPLPEPLHRYINGLFTLSVTRTRGMFSSYLVTY